MTTQTTYILTSDLDGERVTFGTAGEAFARAAAWTGMTQAEATESGHWCYGVYLGGPDGEGWRIEAREQDATARPNRCARCGDPEPVGQSCGCFDNGCE